jgi:hypothetical protein
MSCSANLFGLLVFLCGHLFTAVGCSKQIYAVNISIIEREDKSDALGCVCAFVEVLNSGKRC